MLRALALGISVSDLDYLTVGFVMDMYTEKANDEFDYDEKASQEDFDAF